MAVALSTSISVFRDSPWVGRGDGPAAAPAGAGEAGVAGGGFETDEGLDIELDDLESRALGLCPILHTVCRPRRRSASVADERSNLAAATSSGRRICATNCGRRPSRSRPDVRHVRLLRCEQLPSETHTQYRIISGALDPASS